MTNKEMEIGEFRFAVMEVLPKAWEISVPVDIGNNIDCFRYTITSPTGYKHYTEISMIALCG